jgi:AraC-like DNA-binding protein
MKFLSKKIGQLPVVATVPHGFETYQMEDSVSYFISQSGAGSALFQQWRSETCEAWFYDLFPTQAFSFVQHTNEMVIVFELSLQNNIRFQAEELGDLQFHERAFNFYYLPSLSLEYELGNRNSAGLRIYLSLNWLKKRSVSFPFLEDFIDKIEKRKAVKLTKLNQVAPLKMMQLADRLKQNKEDRSELLERLLLHALEKIKEKPIKKVPRISPDEMEKFYQAKNYIQQHLEEPISVEGLARAMQLNAYRLTKCFEWILQESVQFFLWEQRMRRAAELLEQDKHLMVMDIAFKVGYKDQGAFTKAFKRLYGIIPKRIRSQPKKKPD